MSQSEPNILSTPSKLDGALENTLPRSARSLLIKSVMEQNFTTDLQKRNLHSTPISDNHIPPKVDGQEAASASFTSNPTTTSFKPHIPSAGTLFTTHQTQTATTDAPTLHYLAQSVAHIHARLDQMENTNTSHDHLKRTLDDMLSNLEQTQERKLANHKQLIQQDLQTQGDRLHDECKMQFDYLAEAQSKQLNAEVRQQLQSYENRQKLDRDALKFMLAQQDKQLSDISRKLKMIVPTPNRDAIFNQPPNTDTNGVIIDGIYKRQGDPAAKPKVHIQLDHHNLNPADATSSQQYDNTPSRDAHISPPDHPRTGYSNMQATPQGATTATNQPTLKQPAQTIEDTQVGQGYLTLANKISDMMSSVLTPQPINTKREAPKISAPTYDGTAESSFEMWRTSLEDMFAYLQWPENDPQRLLLLPTVLTGFAKVHFNSLKPQEKSDYKTAMLHMSNTFSITNQPPTARAARLHRRQGLTESVRDYSLEIIKRMQECNILDADRQLDIYIQNLREDIAQKVLMMLPTSLRHAQTCAETAEHTLNIVPDQQLMSFQQNDRSRKDNYYKNNYNNYNNRYPSQNRGRSWSRNRHPRNNSNSRSRERPYPRSTRRYGDGSRPTSRDRQNSYNPRGPSRDRQRRSPTPYNNNKTNALDSEYESDEHSKNE